MALPKLPEFKREGTLTLADMRAIVEYLRAITPIVGGDVTPHFVAGGAMLNGGGGGGGGLVPVKITATVTAATCTSSGVTAFGAGQGKLILADGTLGQAVDIKSHYPDEVPAPRHGWATRGPDGEYWLVEASCSVVPS